MQPPPAARLQISRLSSSHAIENFNCGDPARDSWLQRRAVAGQSSDDSRTYVATDNDASVIGYYAITTGSILRATLPGAWRRIAPDPVSCLLLAQLAVMASQRGRGLSIKLVLHALSQAARVAEIAGCRLVVVHPATPALIAYYREFEFIEIESSPLTPMAISMQKVRAMPAATSPEENS